MDPWKTLITLLNEQLEINTHGFLVLDYTQKRDFENFHILNVSKFFPKHNFYIFG